MAKKRMTTTQITDSDDFISMPSPSQALYLHLNNGADDDGFNNQVQMAMYKAHASVDDLKILLSKRFILQFESGVIVIKHWRMANSLRKDRYTPTVFQEELSQLGLKDNGSYTWLPNGCQMVATDKDSIDKNSIDKYIYSETQSTKKPVRHKHGEYGHVLLTEEQYAHLLNDLGETKLNEYIKRVDEYVQMKGKSYKDYNLTIRNWYRKDGGVSIDKPRKEYYSDFD